MVDDVLLRARQIASSMPEGPVYITGDERSGRNLLRHRRNAARLATCTLGGLSEAAGCGALPGAVVGRSGRLSSRPTWSATPGPCADSSSCRTDRTESAR